VKNLAGELIGERQMEAKPARLIEILGNGWRDKILKFIKIHIERLDVAFLNAFVARLGCCP